MHVPGLWRRAGKFEKALHQTCTAHLLPRCDELLEAARGRGREIPRAVEAILLGALELRDRRDANEIGEQDFQAELVELQERLLAQLARPVSGTDTPQGRLLRHLHREFDALFTFLSEPISLSWWRAPVQVLLPPQTFRLTTAGRSACSTIQLVAGIAAPG